MKKQNKALIISASAIFGLAFFVSGTGVQAQEKEIKIVEAPKIYVEKVTVDPVVEDAGKITGKFKILSQESKNYYDIYYEVHLYNVIQRTLALDEKEAYNPENWRMVASYPNQTSLIVQANETRDIDFSLNIPENKPAGIYIVAIQLHQKDVTSLGERNSNFFNLSGNNIFLNVDIKKIAVLKQGKPYAINAGVDFGKDETPVASIGLQNVSEKDLNVYSKTIIYDRNRFSAVISEVKGENIIFSKGLKKVIEIELKKTEKPGSYLAMVQFFNAENNQPVSASVPFRFVIRGESGRILELSADKTAYNKGDLMKIGVAIIGSADSTIMDEKGNVIENPDRKNQGQGILKISVIDANTNKEIYNNNNKEVALSEDSADANFEVQLKKDLSSYKIKAILEKDGKILHEKTIESVNPEPQKDKIMDIIKAIMLIIVILPLIVIIGWKLKRKISSAVFIIVSIMFGWMFLTNTAQAALIISWDEVVSGHHYNWDSSTCTNGANSRIYSKGTISSNVCENEPEGFTAITYIDGVQICSVDSEASAGNPSGWFCGVGTVNDFLVGSHSMRVKITSSFTSFDQTRTFYIDDNGGCIDVQTRWNDDGTLRGLANATGSVSGRSCTTNGSGHCMIAPYQPISTTVTASKSEWETQSKTTTLVSGIGYASFVMASVATPSCGDGTCNGGETCDSCSGDCGACPTPTCYLSFSPSTIVLEDISTYKWSSTNDADGQIPYSCTNGLGSGTFSSASGSGTTSPTQTSTCTLTVVNASGQSNTCSKTITVITSPPPTCDLRYWSPSPVTVGSGSTFSWTSTDATSALLSCSGPKAVGEVSVSVDSSRVFSGTDFSTTGTELCKLNFSGPGGSVRCDRSLTVQSDPVINNPPVAVIDTPTTNQSITEGTAISFSGSGTDSDAGDTITAYEWRNTDCNIGALFSSASSFSKSDFLSSASPYWVYLRVQDNNGMWSSNCPVRSVDVTAACSPTSYSCVSSPGNSCDASNCEQTITTQNSTCFDDCNSPAPGMCNPACVNTTTTCPACSNNNNVPYKEVAP